MGIRPRIIPQIIPLKNLAHPKRMHFGMAGFEGDFAANSAILNKHCSLIMPTHTCKWVSVQATEGVFNLSEPLTYYNNAKLNGQLLKYHTLLYAADNAGAQPSWLDNFLDTLPGKAAIQTKLQNHISGVSALATSLGIKFDYIDVVNEAINNANGISGSWRDTRWYRGYGDSSYIIDAFTYARTYFPNSKLGYNDNTGRYSGPNNTADRAAEITLIGNLVSAGLIDYVGLQSHIQPLTAGILDATGYSDYIDNLTATGVKEIWYTEIDDDDSDINGEPEEVRLALIAARFKSYLDVILSKSIVKGVIGWGVCNDHNAINSNHPRVDGLPQRGLIFDFGYQTTPTFSVFSDFYKNATIRP